MLCERFGSLFRGHAADVGAGDVDIGINAVHRPDIEHEGCGDDDQNGEDHRSDNQGDGACGQFFLFSHGWYLLYIGQKAELSAVRRVYKATLLYPSYWFNAIGRSPGICNIFIKIQKAGPDSSCSPADIMPL